MADRRAGGVGLSVRSTACSRPIKTRVRASWRARFGTIRIALSRWIDL
jgi:hypothetical protein